jgi:acetyl esterase/lipase
LGGIIMVRLLAAIALMLIGLSLNGLSQISEAPLLRSPASDLGEAVRLADSFVAEPNITYVTVQNYQAKLDIYRPANKAAAPAVIYIHGGGWVNGTKEEVAMNALPFMALGFAVINVEYRLAKISPAPAAVEDCLCVLHWVGRHSKEYNIDPDRVIVAGASAGGHLALTTAMIPTSAGFESECANDDDYKGGAGLWPNYRVKVAAVINWFGITDVADLLHGANTKAYAVTWVGSQPDREEMARKMSPLTYVRSDLPPILSIHGDQDAYVPYSQAVRLHEALTKAGVKNQLLTISGKGHGDFNPVEDLHVWMTVQAFLTRVGVLPTK